MTTGTDRTVESSVRRAEPRWLRRVLDLDYLLTTVVFVALVLITFAGVISRYFLGDPFAWLEELQLTLFLGLIYLGGAAAFRAGGHVAIDVVVDLFSPRVQRLVKWVVAAVVTLILGFFALQGIRMVANLAAVDRATNILRIPAPLIYSAVPVGLVWMIISYLVVETYGVIDDDEEVPHA